MVAVVEVPARLLAAEEVDVEGDAVLPELRGPMVLALDHLALHGRSLPAPARSVLRVAAGFVAHRNVAVPS